MKKLLLLVLTTISFELYASDWQYAGSSTNKNGVAELVFFNAESVQNKNNVLRFWVKSVLTKSIEKEIEKHNKNYVDQAANKVLKDYLPTIFTANRYKKYLKTKKEMNDARIEVILYEIAANSAYVLTSSQFYWELDCNNNYIRYLEATAFDNKGVPLPTTFSADKGRYIAPDSNGEDWKQMFCKK